VPAVARADVPQSGVAAQPRCTERARERRGRRDPGRLEVFVLLEVQVEEVVGGGATGGDPRARGRVDAAVEVGADLEEAEQIGALAAERERVEAFARRSELGGDAEAQPRQRAGSPLEGRSGVVCRVVPDARRMARGGSARDGGAALRDRRSRIGPSGQSVTAQRKNADSWCDSTAWYFCQNSASTARSRADVPGLR
jgi:hypothetical protein